MIEDLFIGTILAVAFFFCSLMSASLRQHSRSRLERYCNSRRAERFSQILIFDEPAAVSVRMTRWLVVSCFIAYFTWRGGIAWGTSSLMLGLLFLVADQLISEPLSKVIAEAVVYWGWPLANLLRILFFPFIHVQTLVSRLVHRIAGRRVDDENPIEEEIRTVVSEGEREGRIHEDAADMIEGLIALQRVAVSEIMTPRTDMVMVRSNTTLEEVWKVVNTSGHSRIPVFGESRDDIKGIFYAKDLLPLFGHDLARMRLMSDLPLRKPVYVPETKLVDELLRQFQKERVHISIVLDEYGGVAGLVTIEDILEEIVGEIADEYDDEEEDPIFRSKDGVIEVAGRTSLETLNEALALQLPEDGEYETIAGFIFGMLGRIPKEGETIEFGRAIYTILAASERTIERVRIATVAATPTGDAVDNEV